MSKPSFLVGQFAPAEDAEEYEKSFAIACAIFGALMSAMAYIAIRKVGQIVHVMVHIVYFGFVTILLSLPVIFINFQFLKTPSTYDIGLFVTLGILAFLAQYFINMGYA